MSILLIGLNHRTAPVEIREQLAFGREAVSTALLLFRHRYPDCEAALLATCNRVEMVVSTDPSGAKNPTHDDMVRFIAEARELPVAKFRPYLYELSDEQAVRHFFRVVAGLDSMVLGDFQIINQARTAYAQASEQGTTGRLLNRLFHQAFMTSKRVRSETEIGLRKVSVSSVAVDVAQQIFTDLSDKQVLVVGAGETAGLVCECLRKASVTKFVLTSRTLANARLMAESCDATAVPLSQLDEELCRADIVITATNCTRTLIGAQQVRAAQKARQHKPLFIIDLSVPRNVAADVEDINQVLLYDVDALGKIVAENQAHRMSQVTVCESILDQEINAFERWLCESRAQPLIEQMYTDANELRDLELSRFFAANDELTDAQRAAVRQLADRLINKLLHPCAYTLRRHSKSDPTLTLAQSLHELTIKQKQIAGRRQA